MDMVREQGVFDLSNEIDAWQQKMRTGNLTDDDIEELTSHLSDVITELQQIGLTDEEAWIIALKRIGEPAELETEYIKLNIDFANGRDAMIMFWGAAIIIIAQTLIFETPTIYGSFKLKHTGIWAPIDLKLTRMIAYISMAIIASLTIFNFFKRGKASAWFLALINRYNIIAVVLLLPILGLTATWSFKIIAGTLFDEFRRTGQSAIILDTLAIVFYGSIIFWTAWLTIRFKKKELRSDSAFRYNITWLNALVIALIIWLVVNASNIATSVPLRYAFDVVCFAFGGYVAGHSKTYKLNLFIIQCAALISSILFLLIGQVTFAFIASDYLLSVIALLLGSTIALKKMRKLYEI